MNIIFYSRRAGGARQIELLRPAPLVAVGLALTFVFGLGLLAGGGTSDVEQLAVSKMERELADQREEIALVEAGARQNLDALAVGS